MANGNGKPKNILFLSFEACAGDLAYRLKLEGYNVKWFVQSKADRVLYDGFLDKVDEWESHKDWADLIIIDDAAFGTIADRLRKEGKPVVGGSSYSDRLELDRDFGAQEMKAVGLTIPDSWEFDSFDEATKFVIKNPARYVVKPSGKAQNDKVLSFVGHEEDGKDVVAILDRYKVGWGSKVRRLQIQKFVSGIEVAVGGFFNGQEFIMPVCINFEHKKLFAGEIGPSTGEMGCYDEETEVLTQGGWKRFRDVSLEDRFASVNPESDEIEYHRPSAVVQFDHHKKMVRIRNRATDLLVTLDHQMFGQEATRYRKKKQWTFVKAKNLPHQFVVPRSGCWKGKEEAVFSLPALRGRSGHGLSRDKFQPLLMAMDHWLAFLGLWLAEGWTSEKSYQVGISQVNARKARAVQETIERLPFRFRKVKGGWKCYDKRLWAYLKPFGHALTKYIPSEYKEQSPRQLAILFDHMCLGDGNKQRTGFRIYYTSSPRLADDVQELLLKMGRVGIVKRRLRRGGKIGTRVFQKVHPCYEVIERIQKTNAWLDRRDTTVVDYKGRVYCVTVPYHTLYVRRNGKPLWCGNTSMFWTGPSRLYRETIEKMVPRLKEAGYVGYFDINCIATARNVYPLEITPRFGYPTVSIQMEGIQSPWGEFLYALANKKPYNLKTQKGFQVGVVIALPPWPFADLDTFRKFSEDAVVIFTKPGMDGIHLGDVKLEDGDWKITGRDGYALVITGSGSTMEEAHREAYSRVKTIIIPNMFYRTDIGFRWRHEGDLLHTWGLLA